MQMLAFVVLNIGILIHSSQAVPMKKLIERSEWRAVESFVRNKPDVLFEQFNETSSNLYQLGLRAPIATFAATYETVKAKEARHRLIVDSTMLVLFHQRTEDELIQLVNLGVLHEPLGADETPAAHVVASRGFLKLFTLLKSRSMFRLGTDREGCTAAWYTTEPRMMDLVLSLYGVNARDQLGRSVLFKLVLQGQLTSELARVLRRNGADLNILDGFGLNVRQAVDRSVANRSVRERMLALLNGMAAK